LFVPTKRPFSSEGHLHLPTALGPLRPGPFVKTEDSATEDSATEDSATEDSATLQIQDDTYADLGLAAGDKLVLRRGRTPEHGDVVLVDQAAGCAGIWKAYPERERLLLRRGAEERSLGPDTPIVGVVIAVKRPLRA
jgi:SOS-response transcriptional repressor LexA